MFGSEELSSEFIHLELQVPCRDGNSDAAAGHHLGDQIWTGDTVQEPSIAPVPTRLLPVLEEGDHPHFTELAHAECRAELLDWTPMFIYTGWKHLQSDTQTT